MGVGHPQTPADAPTFPRIHFPSFEYKLFLPSPMKLLEPIHRLFETWIDPFGRDGDLRPPALTLHFFWFYIRQAKLAFLALLVLGGLVALVETALFYYVGLAPAGARSSPPTGRNSPQCWW